MSATAELRVPTHRTTPPKRGWFRSNWKWFVPTAFFVTLVLAATVVGGVLAVRFRALKTSDPYQMALAELKDQPAVVARLGEPIENASWAPAGTVTVDGDHGTASLNFQAAGPKGRADLAIQSRMVAGEWGFTKFDVTFADDAKLNLLPEILDRNADETPVFDPTRHSVNKAPTIDVGPTEINLDIPEMPVPDAPK